MSQEDGKAMPLTMNRRRYVQGSSALAMSGLMLRSKGAQAQQTSPEAIDRGGVPPNDYGKDTTAEEITAGLDLSGKTALVTGCNSGIGYETMRVLALRGAHVLGAARTAEKAKTACDSVEGQTTPVVCELTEFDTIVACAQTVQAMDTPIDMLILNAGIMALPELEQVNGIEKHFLVNHLGHFILANRLLEQVKAAPQGRVAVLVSGHHRSAPEDGIQFDDLSGENWEYDPTVAYGHSKLANGLFSLELARRLEGTNATSNSIHPGVIMTNLGRHMPWYVLGAAKLVGWAFMKSVGAGAATTSYVSTHPHMEGISGRYFEHCNPAVPGNHMGSTEMAAKLWTVSEELTQDYLA
jgi:NAD(P)-dependent dehydrogenase (short-subunit alcohol dehydrogenase family)